VSDHAIGAHQLGAPELHDGGIREREPAREVVEAHVQGGRHREAGGAGEVSEQSLLGGPGDHGWGADAEHDARRE
jgi:hypothetical protein